MMETMSNAFGGERCDVRGRKKNRKGKEKQRNGEEAARRQTMWSYLTENFRGLTATDIYGKGRTSSSTSSSFSFVPSGERSFEIGHLPNEIEDLHRWFAGYYRRSV